jgi:hypothetical protein
MDVSGAFYVLHAREGNQILHIKSFKSVDTSRGYTMAASRRDDRPAPLVRSPRITTLTPVGRAADRPQRSTSVAWDSSDGGMVRPMASAVFRLMTSSKAVGASMGSSPGLAPFRI